MTRSIDEAALRAARHMIDHFGESAAAEAQRRADGQRCAGNDEAHEHWTRVLQAIQSLQKHGLVGSR